MENNEDLSFLCKVNNVAEAEYIGSLLSSHKIDYHLKSFYDTAYDGLYTNFKGYGEIYVLPVDLKKAEDLYNKIKK